MDNNNGRRNRPAYRSRKLLAYRIGRALSIVVLIAGVLMLILYFEKTTDFLHRNEQAGHRIDAPDKNRPVTEWNGSSFVLRDDLETTLVAGVDSFAAEASPEETGEFHQCDFLYLIVENKTDKTYSTIHINRDTMTTVDVLTSNGKKVRDDEMQIALSFAYGGSFPAQCRNMIKAVRGLLFDIEIDHYVVVTMDSVPVMNNAVGGVTLEIMDDIDEMKKGEVMTLNGDQALRYVRARLEVADNPTNERRMERQSQYISEFSKVFRAKANEDSSFSLRMINEIGDYLKSDCTAKQLADLSNKMATYEQTGAHKLAGESALGSKFMEFRADPDKLKELYVSVFCEKIGK